MIQYFLPQKADIETFLHTSVDITLGSANMIQPFVDLDVKLTRHILLIVDHVSPSKHRSNVSLSDWVVSPLFHKSVRKLSNMYQNNTPTDLLTNNVEYESVFVVYLGAQDKHTSLYLDCCKPTDN